MPILLRSHRFGGSPQRRPPSSTSGNLTAVHPPGVASAAPSRRPSQTSTLRQRPSQENVLTDAASTDGTIENGVVPPPLLPPVVTCGDRVSALYKRLHINHLIPLIIILVYMMIGAVIFLWLEGGEVEKQQAQTEISRRKHPFEDERSILMKRLEEIFEDRAARRRQTRRDFLQSALDNYDTETGLYGEKSLSSGQHWTFMSAMYFAGTLFTTIGYGDMACVTNAGRIATVIYSFFGIPLMLITLNDLGKFLYAHINSTVKWLQTTLAKIKMLRKLLPCLNKEIKDDEVAMQDVEAQIEVDSMKSEHGSLPSIEELEEQKTPRMGVITALSITFGWIFLCAALFILWEDWTYLESCYFMFISLSTIGLGDVSVARKDLMVLCFVFVIIGLSLVSMCISVVQQAIEDLYVNLIMKLLREYQENLAAGGDQLGASVGMMRMWGSNRAAKFLMPLLSKEKKRYAMEKVEHEAKQAGIDIPPILTDIDEKTGLPKLFTIVEESSSAGNDGLPVIPVELERMVMKQQMIMEEQAMSPPPPPQIIMHTSSTQTDTTVNSEKSEQTDCASMDDSGIQTDERMSEIEDRDTQTEVVAREECGFQTERITQSDAATATLAVSSNETTSQTDNVQSIDEEVQSYLVEQLDAETEMERVETKNTRQQTVVAVIVEKAVQSEDLVERRPESLERDDAFEEEMQERKIKAKRRWRLAFSKDRKKDRRNSAGDLDMKAVYTTSFDDELDDVGVDVRGRKGKRAVEETVETLPEPEPEKPKDSEDASEGSVESLHWDPVDGMHAEKQLPVKKLTAMFESPKMEQRKSEGHIHKRKDSAPVTRWKKN